MQDLSELLSYIASNVDGAQYVALGGSDGLLVEHPDGGQPGQGSAVCRAGRAEAARAVLGGSVSLRELLNQGIDIKGVNSAAVVSGAGFVIESAANDETDLSFVGGPITSGLASSRVLASFLGDGEVLQTMIEYENGPVLLIPLGKEDASVMVATLASVSVLGRTRHSLRELGPELARAVAA